MNITLKTDGLDQMIKALKGPLPVVRVGVMSNKNSRVESKKTLSFEEIQNLNKPRKSGTPLSNTELGAIHEFGSPARGIPPRSFLRVPLLSRLNKELKNSNAFNQDVLRNVMRKGTILPWMQKVAILAEGIVLGAFSSGGYGKWPKWKNSSYSNNTGQLLLDTQQLRDSIGSEVVTP